MTPTSRLPPIRTIASNSSQELFQALQYLRNLYHPPVRGSRRRRSDSDAVSISQSTDSNPCSHLDPFERNYAIKWLTSLLSHLETRTISDIHDSEPLVQSAASILALCSGTSAAGTFYRNFNFVSRYLQSCSVCVRVKDVPLNNGDFDSMGAQTWGGACILSESIVDEPWKFGLCYPPRAGAVSNPNSTKPPYSLLDVAIPREQRLRILELGAGTGLVSLTIGKLLQDLISSYDIPVDIPSVPRKPMPISKSVIIVATDHYPPVLSNLSSNINDNFPFQHQNDQGPVNVVQITTCRLDWSKFSSTYALPTDNSTPSSLPLPSAPGLLNEPFDLIFGADVIYEPEHTSWIKSCLPILLKKPALSNSNSHETQLDPAFHLVIPLRSTHVQESRSVEMLFPFSDSKHSDHPSYMDWTNHNRRDGLQMSQDARYVTPGYGELELCILSKEVIVCEAEDDADDEVSYTYYKIGWSIPRRETRS
ncbi:hypothetical protein AX17_003847 [Amanita inopinata Kibby_2008]|nr:hypothetical protein AX17_003847 [Amanita inopinata Kibby_2008]